MVEVRRTEPGRLGGLPAAGWWGPARCGAVWGATPVLDGPTAPSEDSMEGGYRWSGSSLARRRRDVQVRTTPESVARRVRPGRASVASPATKVVRPALIVTE